MSKFAIEKQRGAATEICTEEVFEQAIQDPSVASNCEMYKNTHDDKYKRRLPGICFHAWFADNKRHEESAQPSGLFIFDIDKMQDNLGTDARTFFHERVEPRIDELSILVAHITPSSNGLRLVAPLRPGMDIEQSQAWLGNELGVQYDGCVKDLARLSFLVPESHFLYLNREALFAPCKNLPATIGKALIKEEVETLEAEEVGTATDIYEADDTYKGVPLKRIVEVLITRTGGEPVEGERNNRIFSTASYLRFICDFDAKRLCELIPHYGLGDAEMMKICQNAANRPRGAQMPVILQNVIRDCQAELGVLGNTAPPSGMHADAETLSARHPAIREDIARCVQGSHSDGDASDHGNPCHQTTLHLLGRQLAQPFVHDLCDGCPSQRQEFHPSSRADTIGTPARAGRGRTSQGGSLSGATPQGQEQQAATRRTEGMHPQGARKHLHRQTLEAYGQCPRPAPHQHLRGNRYAEQDQPCRSLE